MRIIIKMKIKETNFVPFECLNAKEYKSLMKRLLSYVDEVCFSVYPFLDGIEEIRASKWNLSDESMRVIYDYEVTEADRNKTSMIILKNNYHVMEYFLDWNDIFHIFENCNVGITIENPVFIKNGEVIMYALSHEKLCDIDEAIWKKIKRNLN